MPVVLGVDVSLGRGLDVVLLRDRTVKEVWSRLGHSDLRALLEELRPDAVAIDAPPKPGLGLLRDPVEAARVSVPPRPGTHLGRRVAEYELSRRGIGSHQTHFDEAKLFSWMTAGFDTFRAAQEAGYPPFFGEGRKQHTSFEVFPYASYVALRGCLSPSKKGKVAWRHSVLDATGVTGLLTDATLDTLDAACAALTGERFLEGDGCWIGDPREGVIVLPVAHLAERYPRCPAEGAIPAKPRGPNTPRLCECGCGDPVRRRFLPGHDARLKSRLLREMRAGIAARVELERLGWLRTTDTEEA